MVLSHSHDEEYIPHMQTLRRITTCHHHLLSLCHGVLQRA